MSRFFLGSLTCVILTIRLLGQSGDSIKTMVLDDIVISVDLLKSAEVGLSETRIDSLTLSQASGTNLSDLLRTTAAGAIRSYGTNGLTSPSFRGTGSSHTAILWNGINLQSPLSGGQDLSLLPNEAVNEVILQKGGTSSLYGSGAIGGSIQLNNKPHFNKGLELSTQQKMGSFGNYYQSYGIQWGNHRITSITRFFHRKIKNDYTYVNTYLSPPVTEKRQNASIAQQGIIQQNDWRINERNSAGIKIWYQDNQVEIPTSISASNNNDAVQYDEFVRAMLDWNHDRKNYSIQYKQAFVWHNLRYVPATGVTSQNTFNSWINRIELNYNFPTNYFLITGINHTYDRARVDAFGNGQRFRNTTALFASLRTKRLNDRLLAAVNVREEVVDVNTFNFTSSLGLDYTVFPQFKLKSSISRNYRIPTLNDLYWQGDGARGNPDLKPETSFNYEAGFDFRIDPSGDENLEWTTSATFYNHTVDDWIQWHPVGDGITWTPVNLKNVLSRGMEADVSANYKINRLTLAVRGVYTYTKATNKEIAGDASTAELNKQLIYTPLHENSLNLRATYQKWTFTLNHVSVSKQYTEAENRERFALPGYQVINLILAHSFRWKITQMATQLEVNNLLDISYENRRGYPMYGRNYSIGLAIKFNNTKPKKNE